MSAAQVDFIADTSAMVRLLRHDSSIDPFFANKRFAITFVNLGELGLGVLKARNSESAWSRLMEVLNGVEVYQVSNRTPLIYAGIYRELESRGTLIPINDIWVAAVCLEAQLPLLARDEHFSRIPGLTVMAC